MKKRTIAFPLPLKTTNKKRCDLTSQSCSVHAFLTNYRALLSQNQKNTSKVSEDSPYPQKSPNNQTIAYS